MNQKIKIGGVETFSTLDWPGKVSAVIFMQGCPWRCPFCYNAHIQEITAESNVIWEKFMEFLGKRKGLLDAVVFSGGEPLVQNELEEAIDEVKAMGYKIGLHTGGYRPEALKKILPKIDWIGFDIKAPFEEEKYQKAIGLPSRHCGEAKQPHAILPDILKSLRMIIDSGIDFECRTTCDPRILELADIYQIADSLKDLGVKKYHLQKYRPVEGDKKTTDDECSTFITDSQLIKSLKAAFKEVDLRK